MPENNESGGFGGRVGAALRWANPVTRVQTIANNIRNDPVPALIGVVGNRFLPGAGSAASAGYQWLRGFGTGRDWRNDTVPSTNERQAAMGDQIAAGNPWALNSGSPLAQYLMGDQRQGEQGAAQGEDRIGEVWNNAGSNPLISMPLAGGGARPPPGYAPGWFGYGSIGNGGGAPKH